MSTKLDEIIIDLLRRELGNDADLVIALYDAYKARGPRGVKDKLNDLLSKYGIEV
ncbi:hypothetical protein [Thermocladium modestius]|nr:hypothetical protein [Thermocladium modestius]